MTAPNEFEREEQAQRSKAWYAILGLGALTAGAMVILRWLPNNPFHVPSEVPNTSRFNSDELTGGEAPMLGATPSERASLAPGCRVSDIALVQNWRSPLRVTVTDAILRYTERRAGIQVTGWSGESPGEDASAVACVVTFSFTEQRRAQQARWSLDPGRLAVSPLNDLARRFMSLPTTGRSSR